MKLGYMAQDQYGNTYHLGDVKHPRKALLEKLGRTKAQPMYVDLKPGGSKQIGWIIGRCWCTVYEVHNYEKE